MEAELLRGIQGLGFPKEGNFWHPHYKDYSILGSILGSSYFGNLPYCIWDVIVICSGPFRVAVGVMLQLFYVVGGL